jgi:hypothetical protein
MFQSTPTVHQHKGRHQADPETAEDNGQSHQADRADNADDRSDGEAPGPPNEKPKQRAQNLTSVQRVNWQKVEDEQHEVDEPNSIEELEEVGHRVGPSEPGSNDA